MSKVLVVSPDTIPGPGVLAAGPGIRYSQIAGTLAVDYGFEVTLAAPLDEAVEGGDGPCRVVGWDLGNICALAAEHDCVIMPHVHSGLSTAYRRFADPDIPTAVDLYDPVLIENIGLQPRDEAGALSFMNYLTGVLPILKRGDFFVCANERQRYYYLGVLNALGRVNPLTYDERFLELVPFGVDRQPAVSTRRAMRGSIVSEDDKVVLWFSGIYPWFDAYTLVDCMPSVIEAEPRAKLVVMGGVHPRGHAPDNEYKRTRARADELGLVGRSVFFVDWQPYDDRANWYLESDLAVATHKQSLETELSHRTRVIDFLWGGLPVITSVGDAVGAMVEEKGCGAGVPVGDRETLARTIVAILGDDDLRRRMSEAAKETASSELTWPKVVKPLADFCADPRLAADRRSPSVSALMNAVDTLAEHSNLLQTPAHDAGPLAKARLIYKTEGLSAVFGRSVRSAGRKIRGSRQ